MLIEFEDLNINFSILMLKPCLIQVARYLVKSFRQIKSGTFNVAESIQYLSTLNKEQRKPFELHSAQNIVNQFRHVAYGQIEEAVSMLDRWILKGHRAEDAWNNTSVELISASLAHLRYFVMEGNADNLLNGVNSISKPLKNILLELFEMLAFTWMQQNFGDFLRHSGLQVMFFGVSIMFYSRALY